LKLFTAAIFSKITHSVALLIDQGWKFSQYKAWEDVEVKEAPEDRRQSKKVFRSSDRRLEPMFWIPGTGSEGGKKAFKTCHNSPAPSSEFKKMSCCT